METVQPHQEWSLKFDILLPPQHRYSPPRLPSLIEYPSPELVFPMTTTHSIFCELLLGAADSLSAFVVMTINLVERSTKLLLWVHNMCSFRNCDKFINDITSMYTGHSMTSWISIQLVERSIHIDKSNIERIYLFFQWVAIAVRGNQRLVSNVLPKDL